MRRWLGGLFWLGTPIAFLVAILVPWHVESFALSPLVDELTIHYRVTAAALALLVAFAIFTRGAIRPLTTLLPVYVAALEVVSHLTWMNRRGHWMWELDIVMFYANALAAAAAAMAVAVLITWLVRVSRPDAIARERAPLLWPATIAAAIAPFVLWGGVLRIFFR